MAPTNIHKIIRDLEERIDSISEEKSRGFVRQMVADLARDGDSFHCTLKQRQYLLSLWYQTAPAVQEKPKSRLDELRARKAKILKGQRRRQVRENRAAAMDAGGSRWALQAIADNGVSAKMRHRRSICSELHKNPLLKTGTKRA